MIFANVYIRIVRWYLDSESKICYDMTEKTAWFLSLKEPRRRGFSIRQRVSRL